MAEGPSIGEWAALAAAWSSVAGGVVIVRRRGRRRLPARPSRTRRAVVRYGVAARIVAFEALFQTGAAIVDRRS